MGQQSRLVQRGGRWTFRARVPDDVRLMLGRLEITKSFGAVSYRDAVKLTRSESVRADALFADARARSKATRLTDLTDADLQHVARGYLHKLEISSAPMPFDEAERQARGDAASEDAANVGQTVQDASVQGVARTVGREARLSIETDTPAFLRLTEAVQRALLEHYSREVDRAELVPERAYDPLFADVSKSGPPPIAVLKMAAAVELYVDAPDRAALSPKTKASYRSRFSVLTELIGKDKPVGEITRADMREVRDVLLQLPANSRKLYPDFPLRKIAIMAATDGHAPMSAKSAKLYLECWSSLFRFLNIEELASRNPALGLRGPALPDRTNRRPFTVAELNLLFAAPSFNGSTVRGWQFWLPRIGLYTGARFAEILGLKAADIVVIDGVPVIDFRPNELRKLKTKGSRRVVPIHSALVDLGLLAHAAAVPVDGLLFPDAIGPADIIAIRNKDMGNAVRKLIPDRKIVFHSLRHTFKDAATNAGISRDMVATIGGWELPGGRGAMDDYGRDRLAKVLAGEIEKLKYSGVFL